MAALGSKLRTLDGGGIAFWCPGCDEAHQIRVGVPDRPSWTFNGNAERPTFSPSVLVRSGHFAPHFDGHCWCTFYKENPPEPGETPFACSVCHTFVTDGRIQFLGDCTHALAGQTVDLPDWPTSGLLD